MASKKSRRRRANPEVKKSPLKKEGTKIVIFVLAITVIVAIAAVILMSSGNDNGNTTEEIDNPIAVFDTSMGTIKIELYQDLVPNTVDNFIKLANDGFYTNMIFHRIKEGFMSQTGSLYKDGSYATSPYGPIPLEIHPDLIHEDGSVAMARSTDPDSGSCGFYICDGPQPDLDDATRQQFGDRGYAVFGKITEGFEVAKSIASAKLDPDTIAQDGTGRPEVDIIINLITIENQ